MEPLSVCYLELEKMKVEMLVIVHFFFWLAGVHFKYLNYWGIYISSKKNTPNKYQVNVPLKDKIPDFFSY